MDNKEIISRKSLKMSILKSVKVLPINLLPNENVAEYILEITCL